MGGSSVGVLYTKPSAGGRLMVVFVVVPVFEPVTLEEVLAPGEVQAEAGASETRAIPPATDTTSFRNSFLVSRGGPCSFPFLFGFILSIPDMS
jgi:hypothetical protein